MQESLISKKISDSYEKYFIAIHVNGADYYIVWGPDSTNQNNDKLLIDLENNILLFSSLNEALNYLLKPSTFVFDKLKVAQWAESCLVHGAYLSGRHNLDSLLQSITNEGFASLSDVGRDDGLDWVNFINLVGDYAHQADDVYLLRLYKSASLRAFWDYVYDTFFWTIPEKELADRQKLAAVDFDYHQFKNDAIDLISQFKSRFKGITDNA